MQELELKVQGGYTGRGVIAGFCGIILYENHEYWTPQFPTRFYMWYTFNVFYFVNLRAEHGEVFAWGLNQHGQCGIGPMMASACSSDSKSFKLSPSNGWILNVYLPVKVEGLPPVVEVHCGWSHTLAISAGIVIIILRSCAANWISEYYGCIMKITRAHTPHTPCICIIDIWCRWPLPTHTRPVVHMSRKHNVMHNA